VSQKLHYENCSYWDKICVFKPPSYISYLPNFSRNVATKKYFLESPFLLLHLKVACGEIVSHRTRTGINITASAFCAGKKKKRLDCKQAAGAETTIKKQRSHFVGCNLLLLRPIKLDSGAI